MSEKLKKYIHEIEHLKYSSREPMHASLFENKAMLSKIAWDIHSYNAKKFYKEVNSDHNSTLEKYGYKRQSHQTIEWGQHINWDKLPLAESKVLKDSWEYYTQNRFSK